MCSACKSCADFASVTCRLMPEQPGFMRTEMTKGVGFDKFWDDGGGKKPRN